jgi:hypothetical protein
MLTRRESSKINLNDDPPWDTELPRPKSRRALREWELLALCSVALFGLALSTSLPWYESASEQFGPRSRFLLPPIGGSAHAPGTTFWGGLVCVTALIVAVAACIDALFAIRSQAKFGRAEALRHLLVASSSTIVLFLVVLELRATPPFGDGPRLTSGWGAIVGVAAALIGVTAAWSALLQLHYATTQTDRAS